MTVIELIRLLRKVENKSVDVRYNNQNGVIITGVEEINDAVILK